MPQRLSEIESYAQQNSRTTPRIELLPGTDAGRLLETHHHGM
jgi:hypothetical protein